MKNVVKLVVQLIEMCFVLKVEELYVVLFDVNRLKEVHSDFVICISLP